MACIFICIFISKVFKLPINYIIHTRGGHMLNEILRALNKSIVTIGFIIAISTFISLIISIST